MEFGNYFYRKIESQMGSARFEEKSFRSLVTAIVGRFLQMFALYIPMTPHMRVKLQSMRGVNVGKNVFLGSEVYFDPVYPHMITIEDDVAIGGRSIIIVHTSPPSYLRESHPRASYIFTKISPVTIKRGAWITLGVMILPGVTIGENSIITAGSVVMNDIPPNCIAQGNPAKVISRLKNSNK